MYEQDEKQGILHGKTIKSEYKYRGFRGATTLLLMGFMSLVVACSSSSDGGAGTTTTTSTLTTKEVEVGAKTKVSDTSNAVLGALGKTGSASEASDTILKSLGRPVSLISDPDPTSGLESDFIDMLELLLQGGVRSGDTITYDPDDVAACADPLLSGVGGLLIEGDAACVDFFSHISMVILIGDTADQGIINVNYDALTLLKIGFSPSEVFYEWNLAQCKLILLSMFTDGFIPDLDLPELFEGIVRTTLTELGPDHGRVNLSIQQAIKVSDGTENFNLAATSKVFELTANGPEETASAEIGLSSLMAMYEMEDGDAIDRLVDLDLAGVTLFAELTSSKIIFSAVGLGSRPLTIDSKDASSPETDFSFGMDTFSFTVDGTDDSVTFDQAYRSDFVLNDVFELFPSPGGPFGAPGLSGSTRLDIPAGSKWTLLGTNLGDEPVFKSNTGTSTITGTGDFASASRSFAPDSCFALRTSFGFPLLPEKCL